MDAWISSRVLPFVSGTSRATNKTVSPQMLANMKNVPEIKPSTKEHTDEARVCRDYVFDQMVYFLCRKYIYRRSSTAGGN
jgi:hypothetical protein